MKLIALSAFTSSIVTSFHYHMFHGRVMPTDYEWYLQGRGLRRPLRLERNAWYMPEVFLPMTELVVSEVVRSRLAHLEHVQFQQVEFTKLVDYPFHLGDDSYYTPSNFEDSVIPDPRTLFDRLPDVDRMHAQACAYYEMQVPMLSDVAKRYNGLNSAKIEPKDTVAPVEIAISRELIEEYKIVWKIHHVFHEAAFDLICQFIDWDYFHTTEFHV